MRFRGTRIRPISEQSLKMPFYKISLAITFVKLLAHIPGLGRVRVLKCCSKCVYNVHLFIWSLFQRASCCLTIVCIRIFKTFYFMMTSSNENIFPRYWPFVRGIHWLPVNSPHKGHWRGALMFSLISARINDWVNKQSWGWWFETLSWSL